MKRNSVLLAAVAGLAATIYAASASATVLFSDGLQTNLANWTQKTGGAAIVSAPGGGQALSFATPTTGGDLVSKASFTSATGQFTLSFDFIGQCGYASDCGAMVEQGGSSSPSGDGWLTGDTYYGGDPQFADGKWEHVSYTYSGTGGRIALEDFASAVHSGADEVFFRNLVLTDDSAGAPVGSFSVASIGGVPEPSVWAMLVLGLFGLGARLRARRRQRPTLAAA